MASSSAMQETGSSNQKAPVYEIRGRTMTLEEWELVVQVESPVDFLSLAHHGCDLRDVYQASGWILVFLLLLLKPLSQSERKKRSASDAGSEASGAINKKSRKEASDVSASDFKRKRSREAPQVTSQDQLEVARKQRAQEMREFKKKYETSNFVMTPENAREAQKEIDCIFSSLAALIASCSLFLSANILSISFCASFAFSRVMTKSEVSYFFLNSLIS